jgi:hypothetical protein
MIVVYFVAVVLLDGLAPFVLAFPSGASISKNLLAVKAVCEIGRAIDITASIMLNNELAAAHGFRTAAEDAVELGDPLVNKETASGHTTDVGCRTLSVRMLSKISWRVNPRPFRALLKYMSAITSMHRSLNSLEKNAMR